MHLSVRVSSALALLFAALAPSIADSSEDCVTIEIQEKPELSCQHPNPLLRLFMNAPVYFTVVRNQCEESIEIIVVATEKYTSTASAEARSEAEIVGCGEPARPKGWCFKSELHRGKCPNDALRTFD